MKTIAVICSLLTMLFYMGGYFLVFHISQQQIRSEIKTLIQSGSMEDQLDVFYFSAATFERMKVEDHEFIHEGNLYDIVTTESYGSQVKVTCFPDEKEKNLISLLGKYFLQGPSSEDTPASGNGESTLLNFLQNVFIVDTMNDPSVIQKDGPYSFFRLFIYQCPVSSLFNPPPESALS